MNCVNIYLCFLYTVLLIQKTVYIVFFLVRTVIRWSLVLNKAKVFRTNKPNYFINRGHILGANISASGLQRYYIFCNTCIRIAIRPNSNTTVFLIDITCILVFFQIHIITIFPFHFQLNILAFSSWFDSFNPTISRIAFFPCKSLMNKCFRDYFRRTLLIIPYRFKEIFYLLVLYWVCGYRRSQSMSTYDISS